MRPFGKDLTTYILKATLEQLINAGNKRTFPQSKAHIYY
jgi:hypothetical protein